jgi:hypothetical protein
MKQLSPSGIQSSHEETGTVETATKGKVRVTAKIENLEDLYMVNQRLLRDDQVRLIGNPDHHGEWSVDAF